MTDYSAQEANLDEFVDFFNAGDLEGLRELIDDEASAPFFGGTGGDAIVAGAGDIRLRYPGIVATRGELDDEPVVVAWVPGQERSYSRMGFFRFSFTDGDEPLIEHIGYSDEPDEGRLLAEEPDPADIPEGFDWHEWEEGVS